MGFPEKIKMLRKEKKWSQDVLSRAINIHSKHISRYENGKTFPGPETLKKIANVFGVSTDYLMNDDVARDEKIGSSRISVKNVSVHYGLGGTTTDMSVKSL